MNKNALFELITSEKTGEWVPTRCTESYLKKNSYWDFLIEETKDFGRDSSIKEKLVFLKTKKNRCEVCGVVTKLNSSDTRSFNPYCSSKCYRTTDEAKKSLELHNEKQKKGIVITKEILEEYYYHQKLNVLQISKILGCSNVTVSNYLKKFEIEKRPLSEIQSLNNPRRNNNDSMKYSKDYLSEKNLGDLLRVLFGNENVVSQYRITIPIEDLLTNKIEDKTLIIDYKVQFDNKTYLVEYDGPTHFRESKTEYRDKQLDSFFKDDSTVKVVHIPYFIQPDCLLFETMFNINFSSDIKDLSELKGFSKTIKDKVTSIDWNFPQGFISENCIRPVNFNSSGWDEFLFFCIVKLANLKTIQNEIFNSLMINGRFPEIWMPKGFDKEKCYFFSNVMDIKNL